jgi:signal transduction histidine kinase
VQPVSPPSRSDGHSRPDKIVSVVEDNGQGFDRNNVDSAHSRGLVHMSARDIDGRHMFDRLVAGEGTRVKASFPLDNALSPTH